MGTAIKAKASCARPGYTRQLGSFINLSMTLYFVGALVSGDHKSQSHDTIRRKSMVSGQ